MAASPDCSGIQYLIEKLKTGIDSNTKVNQLSENLKLIFADTKKNLQRYYIGSDVTKARNLAEERAKKLIMQLQKVMISKYALPRILDVDCFSVSTKAVEAIYDSIVNPMILGEDEEEEAAAQEAAPIFDEDIFDIFGDNNKANQPEKPSKPVVKTGALFAQSVLDRWQSQLSSMAQDEEFLEKTGLSADWFAETTQEFIKGASRFGIEKKIADISEEALYSPNPSIFLRKVASETLKEVKRAMKLNHFE